MHILPPYILRSIAAHGHVQERLMALQTLAADSTFRIGRSETNAAARPRRVAAVNLPASVGLQRSIYDAKGDTALPGERVRSEGDPPSKEAAVNEAYDNLGATYALYADVYGRIGIDGTGEPLRATVHFGEKYANAFWNGTQMVFGDGDGKVFLRFTSAVDIVGHELTHGVVQHTARLRYSGQPGALNESIADVFGTLVKQRVLNQTADQADWLVGTNVLAPTIKATAIRSLKAPGTAYDDPLLGKDPQPAHMDKYVNTVVDSGGVHINSGIPNHAFYLAAIGIGGAAWEKAGQVWYDTLTDRKLRPMSGFTAFARLTVRHATSRYGKESKERAAIRDAWGSVGVRVREE